MNYKKSLWLRYDTGIAAVVFSILALTLHSEICGLLGFLFLLIACVLEIIITGKRIKAAKAQGKILK